jgi:hypothetical protein
MRVHRRVGGNPDALSGRKPALVYSSPASLPRRARTVCVACASVCQLRRGRQASLTRRRSRAILPGRNVISAENLHRSGRHDPTPRAPWSALVWIEWLRQVRVCARLRSALVVASVRKGQQDYVRAMGLRVRPSPQPAHVETIHAGHAEGIPASTCFRESPAVAFPSAASSSSTPSSSILPASDGSRAGYVVRRRRSGCSSRFRLTCTDSAWHCMASQALLGCFKRQTEREGVPLLGSRSTQMRPPWDSTILRQIGSPARCPGAQSTCRQPAQTRRTVEVRAAMLIPVSTRS